MKPPKIRSVIAWSGLVLALLTAWPASARQAKESALPSLLPKTADWTQSEEARFYYPENLFEYIDGAAESYLSYDFKELAVGQYEKSGTEATLTLEIYDMGAGVNAFGIFSAERFPESPSVPVGLAGYIEGEALNFVSGRFYVKLLAFGLAGETEADLKTFAGLTAGLIGPPGFLPELLKAFPSQGLVRNSEKYIHQNFLGFDFLRSGYLANYRVEGGEFDAFLIKAADGEEAEAMLQKYLEFFSRDGQAYQAKGTGYHLRNRYGQHTFIGRSGAFLCGVTRAPDEAEASAWACFERLSEALARTTGANEQALKPLGQ